ncbi:hypothetical protein RhiJN_25254 [Ceratobasidium sp. AG-Ba]|nr:hypothetical protein RhiJN_25254 [Ceratobasidium sp. AG-Ba]
MEEFDIGPELRNLVQLLHDEERDLSPPPRRFPSVSMEEVEDEDQHDPLPSSPHPFAFPTRPTLYPEPYDHPTAGFAMFFYEVPKSPPPLYNTKLTDPDTFKEAYWLANLRCSQRAKNPYFELPRTRCWYWKNMSELNQDVDLLPHGPEWRCRTLRIPGDSSDVIVHLWMRDIVELVRHLIGNRRFMDQMRFAPELHWASDDRSQRVYDEMWSGDWWWRMQNIIKDGSTIAPIIIAADKTHLTRFSGNKYAWPVYLSIGNISKDIRKRPSERATLLLGFIPVHDLKHISNKEHRSERSWQLFHTCLELMLEPLKTASIKGVEMLCADGGVRRVHPILAAYIADHPEQVTVACTRRNRCPICLVPAKERGDWSKWYDVRTVRQTLDALEDYWEGYSQTIVELGIRPTRPFWEELPYFNMATCLTPDLLHQLNKGMFGEHIVNWCTAILGADELDRRTQSMPRFSKLRHFSEGISPLTQWTGMEAKALGSTFVPLIADSPDGEMVTAARSIVDFMYRAHKPELSEDDLAAMEKNLEEFHDAKHVFINPENKHLLKDQDHFNDIPKLHMLTHFVDIIRELGAPDGYNTEITERLHIDYVKVPWDTTNHVNALQQMAIYIQRQESWALLRAYLFETGQLEDEDGHEEILGDEEMGDDEGELEAGDQDPGEGEIWHPNPRLWIAKRPSLGTRTGYDLMKRHRAPDLITSTKNYLAQLTNDPSSLALSEHSKFKVWARFRLHHDPLPFFPAAEPQTHHTTRSGAFDVVLIAPEGDSEVEGLHRFQAGRVRVIFEVPRYLQDLCSEKLAYVELFRPFSQGMAQPASLYTTGHMMRNQKRCTAVVPISRIRMAIHLVPRYELLDFDGAITAKTDLLSIHNSFFLNKYVSHFHFIVMEYWQKQREAREQ